MRKQERKRAREDSRRSFENAPPTLDEMPTLRGLVCVRAVPCESPAAMLPLSPVVVPLTLQPPLPYPLPLGFEAA